MSFFKRLSWSKSKDVTTVSVSPVGSVEMTSVVSDNQKPSPRILKETDPDCRHVLGFGFSKKKKWAILTAVFITQLSMNFNAGIFGNAVEGLMKEFKVSRFKTKLAAFLFLSTYAFGCELWAPFSEELGRKWVLQGSLFLVNIWAAAAGGSRNFASVMTFRALGGLSSAGGSVTLGMVADMWEPENQQDALAAIVFSSCIGSVLGAMGGGILETFCHWRWIFWAQVIFGIVAQALHFFVPETRSSVLLDRHAKKLREADPTLQVYGPTELEGGFWERLSFKRVYTLISRPFVLLCTEPIVLFLSMLSGFSDALIFTAFDSFGMVLAKWNFTKLQIGLAFTSILLGNFVGWMAFLPVYRRQQKLMREKPHLVNPEHRLKLLLFLVILEPIGLLGFSFGSLGPPSVHWMVPLFFAFLIGIANYAIYLATVDYMLAAYGGEAGASATGCNGFCRDLFAGIAALYTKPFYSNINSGTKWQLPSASFVLTGIATGLSVAVPVFYFKGEWFRNRSPYAQKIANERDQAKADSTPDLPPSTFVIAEA